MFNLFAQKPAESTALDFPSAMAALLVHIARSDDHYDTAEISVIEKILADRFAKTTDQAQDLRKSAETLEEHASDTVRFTRAIKDAVPYESRIDIVRDLWRVVLVDGTRDMYEDSQMRLVVNLLGVNDHDSAIARQQVSKVKSD